MINNFINSQDIKSTYMYYIFIIPQYFIEFSKLNCLIECFCMASIDSERLFRSDKFSFGKWKMSHGIISGEYDISSGYS